MASGLSIPELDDRISVIRDNIRQLVEQAAAQSGAGDEARTSDRIADQTRELPSVYAFAPGREIPRRLLQLRQNASILEQGSAGFSPGPANRCNQFTPHPGRTSSPLRPRLSFGKHKALLRQRGVHLFVRCLRKSSSRRNAIVG